MKRPFSHFSLSFLLLIGSVIFLNPISFADDSELYTIDDSCPVSSIIASTPPGSSNITTTTSEDTIMIVVDDSLSMNFRYKNQNCHLPQSHARISIIKNVLRKILDKPKYNDLSFGISGLAHRQDARGFIFAGGNSFCNAGAGVASTPGSGNTFLTIRKLGENANRNDLKQGINQIRLTYGTPVVPTLKNIYQYYRDNIGKNLSATANHKLIFFSDGQPMFDSNVPVTNIDIRANLNPNKFDPNNNIGLPGVKWHSPKNSWSFMRNLLGQSNTGSIYKTNSSDTSFRCKKPSKLLPYFEGNAKKQAAMAGVCAIEIAEEIHKLGVTIDTMPADSSPGPQQFMEEISKAGGGKMYPVQSTDASISGALANIIEDINTDGRRDPNNINYALTYQFPKVYHSPSISLKNKDDLANENEIFFSSFQPSHFSYWGGNLEKYLLSPSGEIVLADGTTKVTNSNGTFKTGVKDIWQGGASNKLKIPNARKLYTDLDNSVALKNRKNALKHINNDLKDHLTANNILTSAENPNDFINWIRGKDTLDEDNDNSTDKRDRRFNDSIHSKPTVVSYGTSSGIKKLIFSGDNFGFIKATNADNGKEIFSFLPSRLFSHVAEFYRNPVSYDRRYGFDGPIVAWVFDENNDGIDVTKPRTDRVHLYATMRRGGNAIYAFDVTDIKAPTLLWTLDANTLGFEKLGQTWSRPIKTKIKDKSGIPTEVLIFGGGYDERYDAVPLTQKLASPGNASNPIKGNAIFIVDAITGDPIWSFDDTDNPKMKHSIPSDIKVIDINNDQLPDQLYFGDLGGQLWRFDLTHSETAPFDANGYVFAELEGAFFEPPTVSVLNKAGQRRLAISLGSGFRPAPLSKDIQDRFYLLYTKDIYAAPKTPVSIELSDLFNASKQVHDQSNEKGWYINLNQLAGEKILTSNDSLYGYAYFTTFTPSNSGNVACETDKGSQLLYRVKLYDATDSNNLTTGRTKLLHVTGLPQPPVFIKLLNKGGDSLFKRSICVGSECFEIAEERISKSFWREYQ